MALSMPSEELELLIAGYVLGDLDVDEALKFEQLLSENPAIAEAVAQMQQALEIAYVPAEVAPPVHLRSAILQAATPAPANTWAAHRSSGRQRRSRSFPLGKTMGAVAAVLIAALAFNNYRLWQTLQATQAQLQQQETSPDTLPETLIYSLQGTDVATAASATVVVRQDQLEAVIDVENLPPLSPGKVYVLWTVVAPGTPVETDPKGAILTEVFQVNPEGSFFGKITVPEIYRSTGAISKVAVTLEDAAAPENHSGPIMMMTSL